MKLRTGTCTIIWITCDPADLGPVFRRPRHPAWNGRYSVLQQRLVSIGRHTASPKSILIASCMTLAFCRCDLNLCNLFRPGFTIATSCPLHTGPELQQPCPPHYSTVQVACKKPGLLAAEAPCCTDKLQELVLEEEVLKLTCFSISLFRGKMNESPWKCRPSGPDRESPGDPRRTCCIASAMVQTLPLYLALVSACQSHAGAHDTASRLQTLHESSDLQPRAPRVCMRCMQLLRSCKLNCPLRHVE